MCGWDSTLSRLRKLKALHIPKLDLRGHFTVGRKGQTDRERNGGKEGLTEIAGQDNDGQPNLQGLTLQDKLARPVY